MLNAYAERSAFADRPTQLPLDSRDSYLLSPEVTLR
jgi:hypothetical protein